MKNYLAERGRCDGFLFLKLVFDAENPSLQFYATPRPVRHCVQTLEVPTETPEKRVFRPKNVLQCLVYAKKVMVYRFSTSLIMFAMFVQLYKTF